MANPETSEEELAIALGEALADYENCQDDDGDTDEYGFPVPGWVILARQVLKERSQA